MLASALAAQVGTVRAEQKISETQGGFGGVLDPSDHFGQSLARLGDLDGDGVSELAIGAPYDDDGGLDTGAVWILFMHADGTVASQTKISETSGGFGGSLINIGFFGTSLAALGDLNGDGIDDLAVGYPNFRDSKGSVWILFLDANGTVHSKQQILGRDSSDDWFGRSIANLGDLDGDGIVDLAVGANGDDDGGSNHGAVWIVYLNADGTAKSMQKISEQRGGPPGELSGLGYFGYSVAALGDLDQDGTGDIAVGDIYSDDGGRDQGAVWILFLQPDGTFRLAQKISETSGGLGPILTPSNYFGEGLASLGDLDGDGSAELAVGSRSGGQGTVWILFLNPDGTVRRTQPITENTGGFGGHLDPGDNFGVGLAALGDLDGDGNGDLAAGAFNDSDDGPGQGCAWILFLAGPECFTLDFQTEDDLATPLANGQHVDTEFGRRVTITSAGANAGAAIFDSSPGGPNDPGADEDLLIGHGHLLLLQDDSRASQTVPGFFDVPVDDPDGGDLVFTFAAPSEAHSVVLVDLDPPPNQGAAVTLSDGSNRTRVYTVPPGWTGTYGVQGLRTLDLTTLAPQVGNAPGFRLATAIETPGFLASDARTLTVHLTGLGAVDDLAWCTSGSSQARASATVRDGSGVNPLRLSSMTTPVLGGTWGVRLDCSGHASGFAILAVKSAPVRIATNHGEILAGGQTYLRSIRPHVGATVTFGESIPNLVALVGLGACSQGLCTGSPGPQLTNAVDVVLGF